MTFPAPRSLALAPYVSRRLLAVSAAALLLTSCANFKGIGSTAQTRTPADYATTASLPSQGGQWPTLSWTEQIGGAPLQALVDEALANNPNLQAAAARVNAARAIAEAARASERPTLGASFNVTRERYTENGIFPPPLGGAYVTDSELALNFGYEFDFWGKHASELRAALSQGKAAEAEQYTSRLVLTTAIARAWTQLARQYAQLDFTSQQLAVRQKIDRLIQLRFAAGLDTQSENQQSRQQLANLRVEQTQWQEAIALTRNQLAALMGKGPDRGQSIARPNLPVATTMPLPNELPLNLLGRRPDVVAARWHVEAAQGQIENAKSQFYPNVNLTAFAGFSSLGLSNLLQSGSRTVGIGPAIRLPIFEGGALRAQLKGRVASYDAAVATYNQTLTDALHEVADQVQSLRAAETQSEQQRIATQAAENGLKLAEQRERVGTTNMLPALSIEMALLTQRKAELDTLVRRTDLRIGLIRALGGGFDAAAQGLETTTGTTNNSNLSSRSTLSKSAS